MIAEALLVFVGLIGGAVVLGLYVRAAAERIAEMIGSITDVYHHWHSINSQEGYPLRVIKDEDEGKRDAK